MLEDHNIAAFDEWPSAASLTRKSTPGLVRRGRGRPPAVPSTAQVVQSLGGLTTRQTDVTIFMLADFAANAVRVPGGVFIERCPTYYVGSGSIPISLARRIYPLIVDLLGAVRIKAEAAEAAGVALRRLAEGARRGHCLFIRDHERAGSLLAQFKKLGRTIPDPASFRRRAPEPRRVDIVWRGTRAFMQCPFHDDRDPSALVNPNGNVTCFGAECAAARHIGWVVFDPEGGAMFTARAGAAVPRASAPFVRPVTAPFSCNTRGQPGRGEGGEERGSSSLCTRELAAKADYSHEKIRVAGSPGQDRLTGGHLLGSLFHDRFVRRREREPDVIEILRSAERDLAPSALSDALSLEATHEGEGVDARSYLPDLYVSLDHHVWVRPSDGGARSMPQTVDTIGVDLDGFTGAPVSNAALALAGDRILDAIRRDFPMLTGRLAIVRTSHFGVQVLARLAIARWGPWAFYSDEDVRRMLDAFDALCLSEVQRAGFEGGHADRSIHAAGRYVRLPGARKTKQKTVYVSRLAYLAE